MDTTLASPLLGGLTPQTFMRRHWQKKPLLVRQAIPAGLVVIERAELLRLAASEAVESRLIAQREGRWSLRHGPFSRAAIPPFKRPHWTLLVQGLDLHLPAARALLDRFRFVPDARLDDVMVSYASDGGGVGPHVDSYDVFLLQTLGRRRWRIGRAVDIELVADVPLKMLARFKPEQEFLLEPGDMLYLPPGWAHDGVAVGECMTCSIGFRAAGRDELAREVLQRVLDAAEDEAQGDDGSIIDAARGPLYRDPTQPATAEPGRIPPALTAYARAAVARLLGDPRALACALGEVLSEPKRGVWFEANASEANASEAKAAEADAGDGGASRALGSGVRLDRRTRALYDDAHVYLNGESYRAGGRDARLMRRLCDARALSAAEVARVSPQARALVHEWLDAGWLLRDDVDAARPASPVQKSEQKPRGAL